MPRVLVVASPSVYATAIAARLRHEDAYEVLAPNINAGEPVPPLVYDAVLTTATTSVIMDVAADVVITLPMISFDEPVIVTAGGVTVPVHIDRQTPIDDVVSLLGRYVRDQKVRTDHA